MRRVYPITRNPKQLSTGRYIYFPEHDEILAISVLNPTCFIEKNGTEVKLKEDEYIVGNFLFDGLPDKYYVGTYEEIKELCRKENETIKKLKNNNL
jgi:hypothetical protein